MTTAYTAGTITLTNGSAVVAGAGTAWQTALIVGGVINAEAAGGNSMPIQTVDSDTQITAAVKWKGATGSYSYALVIDTAYDRQVLANATALAQILQALQKPSVSALSALTPANNKLPWFNGANTATLADFTAFARSLLDDADASAALSTLGVSAFAKTILDDADAAAARTTIGALASASVSAFMGTVLDDADAATARATLGAQASLGFTPVNRAGDSNVGSLAFTAGKTVTIPTGGTAGGVSVNVDGAGATWSIAASAFISPAPATFSGLIVANCLNDGSTALFLCGGNSIVMVSQSISGGNFSGTAGTVSKICGEVDTATGRYYLINRFGTAVTVNIFLIRLKAGN
ncbi:hypothetical protein F3X89_03695 [Rhizobium rhizogenes]|uniref:hypothetical protein n=1 Tax=Rhizobium rhizogenes TaxID=359 RepID=UPI00193E567E|nr:hypothetical protein [Rhizobium rhizogenes]QRM36939.1 hypothetical protein F3X89_03695 [Rhizobium rhizogenes]